MEAFLQSKQCTSVASSLQDRRKGARKSGQSNAMNESTMTYAPYSLVMRWEESEDSPSK